MPNEFEPEQVVQRYRDLIGQLETTTLSESQRAQIQQAAQLLRESWKEWQGEDSLIEMAYGEPWRELGRVDAAAVRGHARPASPSLRRAARDASQP